MTDTLDSVLRYATRLARLSTTTARVLAKDIDVALPEVDAKLAARLRNDGTMTVARLRNLRAELDLIRAALRALITGDLADALDGVSDTTATLAGQLVGDLRAAAGVTVSVASVAVPVETVRAAAGEFDGRSWTAWGERLADDVLDRVETELRRATAQGETLAQVRRRLRTAASLGKVGAERLARTSLNAVATAGRQAAVEQLAGDLPFRWRYVATLDSRTSLTCAALDGREWDPGDPDIPRPPRHPNCRSTIVPVLDGVRLTGQRAAQGGPVKASETFEQWFRRQDAEFQQEFLGPMRFDAWEAGVPLDRMATPDRPLTVAELRALYPGKTA